jgi:nucleoside-diphosphate-sugar epimerase
MRVFVAGATGVIGQYLVPGLSWRDGFSPWADAFKSGRAA